MRCNSGLQWARSTAVARLRGAIDTVLVAGGDEGAFERGAAAASLPAWLPKLPGPAHGQRLCTGAFALAAAGLLDDRRATTHWQSCARLARDYPRVQVDPDAIYVADPPCYSSAGISAAIDLSLALVEADLGQPLALSVARELVPYLRRPGGQSQFSAGLQAQMESSQRFRDLLMWMHEHLKSDLSAAALAARMSISERHFARLFRIETEQTSARFVQALRLLIFP